MQPSESVSLPPFALHYGEAPHVQSVAWLGEGDFCDCYLVNGDYVFRFAKHNAASAAMQREQCLLPVLQTSLTVAVPQVEFSGTASETGQRMMGYPFLAGEPLEEEVLAGLDHTVRSHLIAQLVDFAKQLHAIPLERVHACALPQLEPLPHLTSIMEQGRMQVAPLLPKEVWNYYETLFEEYRRNPAYHIYQPALLHGDLSPDHFIGSAETGTLTGVIDFGDACIGDPVWDLIYICEDYSEETFNTFMHLYAPDDVAFLTQKVCLYQQLNNVGYCLSMIKEGDEGAIQEAVDYLVEQVR